MTNGEIRSWHLAEISKIAGLDNQWVERGDTLEQRARQAWQQRHDLRRRAREMMGNPVEVGMLRERDRREYLNPDGPTFEDLVRDSRSRGLTDD